MMLAPIVIATVLVLLPKVNAVSVLAKLYRLVLTALLKVPLAAGWMVTAPLPANPLVLGTVLCV